MKSQLTSQNQPDSWNNNTRTPSAAITPPSFAAILALCLLLPLSAQSSDIAIDTFNTDTAGSALGGQGGGSGWSASWVNSGLVNTASVVDTSTTGALDYVPTNGIPIFGGSRAVDFSGTTAGFVATRQLAAPQTNTFYVRWVGRWNAGTFSDNNGFYMLLNNTVGDTANSVNFGYRYLVSDGSGNTYFIRHGTATPGAVNRAPMTAQNATNAHCFVAMFQKTNSGGNYNSFKVWIDPSVTAQTDFTNGNIYLNEDIGTAAISYINMRMSGFESDDVVRVDQFKVASTFSDILLNGQTTTYSITTTATPAAGVPFLVTIQATDLTGNPTNNLPVTTLNLVATGSLQLSTNQVTITNGTSVTFTATDNVAETASVTATPTGGNSAPGAGVFTINAGPMAGLQVLAPGEGYAGLSKTGTPYVQGPGLSFPVTIIGVDSYGNFTTNGINVNDTIHLASSDPGAILPANAALVLGRLTESVTLSNAPTQTITATDATDGSIASGISSIIPVASSLVFVQDLFDYPAGDLAGQNGGAGWGSPWFVGTNSSLSTSTVINALLYPPQLNYFPGDGQPILGGPTYVDNVPTGVTASGRNIFGSRKFAAPLQQTFYVAYFLRFDTNDLTFPGAILTYFTETDPGSETAPPQVNFGPNGSDNWLNRESSTAGATVNKPGSTSPGALNYVVARYTYGDGRFTNCDLWINPSNSSLGTPDSTYTITGNYPRFNWIYFRTVNLFPDGFTLGHFKIARFWNDVMPAATPTTIDHFEVTSPASQTASSNFSITVTAKDAGNATVTTDSSTVVTMISSGAAQFDANGDGNFGDNTKTLVNGSMTIVAKDNVAEMLTNIAVAVESAKLGSKIITINPGAFVKLQLLVPGEVSAPNTLAGKTGTPLGVHSGDGFPVRVNAVDSLWNLVPTATDTVHFTSSDLATYVSLPANTPLTGGTLTTNVVLITLPSETITVTDVTDGTKSASVSGTVPIIAPNLTWMGDGIANAWDQTSVNWKFGSNLSTAYADGDGVIFDDSSLIGNHIVNVATNVKPALVRVSGTNYKFTGAGSIGGTNQLRMDGAVTLTIANSNSYSGGTFLGQYPGVLLQIGDGINAGTIGTGIFVCSNLDLTNPQLRFNVPNSANSPLVLSNAFVGTGSGWIMEFVGGAVKLAGTAGDTNAIIFVRTNATVVSANTGSGTVFGSVGAVNLKVDRGGIFQYGANEQITGGGRFEQVDGVLDMHGFSDTVGKISQGYDSISGDPLTNGIIDNVGANSGTIIVGTTFDNAAAWYYPGYIKNTGPGLLNLSKDGTNTMVFFDPTRSTYGGITRILKGTIEVANSNCLQNSTLDLNSTNAGTLTFADTFLFYDAPPANAVFGGLSGSRPLSMVNSDNGPVSLAVGKNNLNTVYSGTLDDAGLGATLTKIGTGTLTLSGTNTYTGITTVSNGTLLVNGSLNGNSVAVANGATLGGNGFMAGPVNVQSGGTILPGIPYGILTSTNPITLQAGSVTRISINRTNLGGNTLSAGSINLGGTLNVTNLGAALQSGDSFTLFKGTLGGTITIGTLPTLIPNLTWDTSTVNIDGKIKVTGTQLPPPVISSLSPTNGPTAGGTLVNITGSNFLSNSTIKFGTNVSATATFINATNITAVTPPNVAGHVNVTVQTFVGAAFVGTVTLTNGFAFMPPPLRLGASAVSGGNLVMVWSGGTNNQCVLLTSTNIALPFSSWTRVVTNSVGANGLSTNSVAIVPATPQSYYSKSIIVP
jgi:autotransporter-associated beta strand protein